MNTGEDGAVGDWFSYPAYNGKGLAISLPGQSSQRSGAVGNPHLRKEQLEQKHRSTMTPGMMERQALYRSSELSDDEEAVKEVEAIQDYGVRACVGMAYSQEVHGRATYPKKFQVGLGEHTRTVCHPQCKWDEVCF